MLNNAFELSEEERKELVDEYNKSIEAEIDDYVSQKREYLIV